MGIRAVPPDFVTDLRWNAVFDRIASAAALAVLGAPPCSRDDDMILGVGKADGVPDSPPAVDGRSGPAAMRVLMRREVRFESICSANRIRFAEGRARHSQEEI